MKRGDQCAKGQKMHSSLTRNAFWAEAWDLSETLLLAFTAIIEYCRHLWRAEVNG